MISEFPSNPCHSMIPLLKRLHQATGLATNEEAHRGTTEAAHGTPTPLFRAGIFTLQSEAPQFQALLIGRCLRYTRV